jgi:hypothetical protein
MSSPEVWRKSSFSGGGNDNACIEVAVTPEAVAVRDSKNPDGPRLDVPRTHWHQFLH